MTTADLHEDAQQHDDGDVAIIRIDLAPGSIVEKGPGYRPSESVWSFRILYVLEDGRLQPATSTHRRRKDAVAEFGSLPKAPENPMRAIFNSDGVFWGTRTQFRIG